jgi:16S rRNA (uracil1498-N3)-methyltransferase
MTRRRFYAPPDELRDSIIALSGEETHHLTHVLRMAPGDSAFVFDGCGREYRCNFRGVKDNRAQLEVGEMLPDVVESPVEITLAQALAKGEKFDLIVQKATELGVSRIVPLLTRYAEARLDDQQAARRIERWRRISLEAVKQCGRRKLVEITAPRTLREFLGAGGLASAAHQTLLLFSEQGGVAIIDALAERSNSQPVVAMVGPEGGWSDDDLAMLNEAGSKAVTLGPRVLRTETAAIVALALIQHAIGDLSTGGTE